jgi:hypothetical protein
MHRWWGGDAAWAPRLLRRSPASQPAYRYAIHPPAEDVLFSCCRRYDGEWVNGVPRCGYYTEMPPDALVPASRLPQPLPPVELAAPERVISDRLAEIRRDRAHVRAERVPLDEHFTPEELEALRVAFGRVDIDEIGEIPLADLPRAFAQVGMEPTDDEMARLLAHLNKRHEPETTFTFAEFSQAADFLAPLEDLEDADPADEF